VRLIRPYKRWRARASGSPPSGAPMSDNEAHQLRATSLTFSPRAFAISMGWTNVFSYGWPRAHTHRWPRPGPSISIRAIGASVRRAISQTGLLSASGPRGKKGRMRTFSHVQYKYRRRWDARFKGKGFSCLTRKSRHDCGDVGKEGTVHM